jgi:hypothetical protein
MLFFVIDNWDTIALLVSNVLAYLAKSPLKKFKE